VEGRFESRVVHEQGHRQRLLVPGDGRHRLHQKLDIAGRDAREAARAAKHRLHFVETALRELRAAVGIRGHLTFATAKCRSSRSTTTAPGPPCSRAAPAFSGSTMTPWSASIRTRVARPRKPLAYPGREASHAWIFARDRLKTSSKG